MTTPPNMETVPPTLGTSFITLHTCLSSNVLVDSVRLVCHRLQLQLDGALEPEAEQLLGVADQEVDRLVGPAPADERRDTDQVVLPLDYHLRKLCSS